MTATPELTADQSEALRPLAAVIEKAIAETPIRLGSDDWGTALGSRLLAEVAAYMGRALGPDAPILAEVQNERLQQDAKWGEQNHVDGTGVTDEQKLLADNAKAMCQQAFAEGRGDWAHILFEEVREVLAESDLASLRAELIQVAAVAVAWVGAIDRRCVA